ncbi:leucine-rich repeat domain-containing protein [Carboxylicivirga sp. M1479]|uniref:leucine-rich repeat domain-containing protein n=1 Tax=Carboxylicivirga sp. M1479 TaxID=2594476 RepID=UPI001177C756|nr:hypothetical protein [Carboxylicivirga sp. M1479]TRX66164.1 hypothetical protein FNN09_14695 [Carboxylicivirga sp. M1479]
MKLTYPLIVLIIVIITACSSDDKNPLTDSMYVKVPDEHFETKLVEQGIDSDGLINQQILRSDAEKVTHLDLNQVAHFGDISDLSGIEGFVNLTWLSAAGHQLEVVDLSNNTQLDTVYLLGNKLSSIDLNNNTKLQLVDLMSNQLGSITGLSKATLLKELELSWNDFETLTIDNATLEVLHMSHNLLTNIYIKDAPQLTNILLSSNKLRNIDLSSNTQLETLLISDNQLVDLNLNSNTQLTHLYGSSNLLGSLDLSHNLKLLDLRIDRNPLLTCIKVHEQQKIPSVSLSDYQVLNSDCK